MVGTLDDAAVRRAHTFSTRAAARILAISPDRIRYWVKRSLVRPLTRGRQMRFGFDDLLVMRLAKELLPTRHHLDPVRRCLERVRGMFGPARPVTSLRLANYDGQIVVRDGNVMVEAMSGQILLNFEAPPAPGKVEERFGPARVRERFEEARRLAESDPLRALTLYSELLGREPGNFEAHIDLAGLLEREGDLAGSLRALLGAAAIVPTNADVHHPPGPALSPARRPAKRAREFRARDRMRSALARGASQPRRAVRIDGPQARGAAPSRHGPSPDPQLAWPLTAGKHRLAA